VSISIAGDDEIPNGSVATYVCTATWSDGATSTATAAWSLSSTEYASVDASGKVTNSNTTATEQTVTLTANYEAGDVKKTATKEISLAKRSLTDVVVEGDGIIPSGGIATYICTAIWSYGDSMTVTPKWSLSSTDYATIDDDGKVTSKNTTDEEKTVTLTASYTYDNVTKTVTKIITLSKRTLNEIAIAGDTTIPTASTATYTCTAIWSYGDSTVATPTWSLSSTTYASIEEDGKVVNKNTTDVDQTVTLTASYTVGDITKTTIKIITLAKRTLNDIVIDGDDTIPTSDIASYTCTAIWSYGESTAVMPEWSLSSTDYASVDADGKVTNQNSTDKNQTVTLTATYTSNDVTKTVAKVITLSKRMLIEVVVNGDETIASGESATYTCTAIWNYGDSTVVTPTWSLSSTDYATVDDNGKVTNMNTTIDEQTVTLTANYTVGDVTKTATKLITLKEIMPLVLELYPGWNLVTLRRSLSSDADGVQKFLSLNPIKCDADNRSYVFCGDATSILPGIGYWIYSRNRQSVKLLQDVEKPVSMLNLKPGWNLIGILEAPDWPSSDVVIWAWENNRFKNIDMADMRPGCAYWVYYIQ
jgi:hypothetical protein